MCKVAPVSVFVTRKSPIYILAILHGEQYSVFTFPFPVEVSVIVNSVGALHPECQRCLHRPLRPGSESPLQCQQCEISSATWLRRRDTALICADPGPGHSLPRKTGRFSRDTALDHKISVIYDFNILKRRFVKDSFVICDTESVISNIYCPISMKATYILS